MRERVHADSMQLNMGTLHSARRQITVLLSLFVILGVFWCLKLTGITMAGEAFCGMDEHRHGDNCPTGRLICEQAETAGHTHDETCILRELICGQDEIAPHAHDESCLHRELTCTEAERDGHTHTDNCRALTLICSEEERSGHAHNDACFTPELICAIEEDDTHTHGPDCYENVLTCETEECEEHHHGDACYLLGDDFICGQEERSGHTHGEACYVLQEGIFDCGLEETEGHSHTGECYHIGIGFGCGSTKDGHVHTDACLTDETELSCGLDSTPPHTHTEACYEALDVCPLEEHIHDETCYSNHDADLETEDDWEASLLNVNRETTTAETLISVARSQLGYAESTLNFEVDLHGVRRGITRYGQWYGNPYGDWSAMFVSFCLQYAGAEDLPANAGPEAMRLEWEEAERYEPAELYIPQVGDLIFLSAGAAAESADMEVSDAETADAAPEYPGTADAASAVGIITEVTGDSITVIQGDWNDTVAERTIAANDPAILGYGPVPESSPFALMMLPRAGELAYLGHTIDYSSGMFTSGRSFVIYAEHQGQYYAIVSQPAIGMETAVTAVPIQIAADGSIYADVADSRSLLWNFTRNGSNYVIQNAATGRYLHPGGDYGIIYDGNWPTALWSSWTGAQFVHTQSGNNVGIYFDPNQQQFYTITNKNNASTLFFGVAETCTVWLDGTQGNLMTLRDSDLQSYSALVGSTLTLPSQWKSPGKYDSTLKGWYDVGNHRYYEPGEEITVTGNMLLYADWIASTYDIGQMNAHVVETVSTNSFITTHMFDYNSLFNTLSQNNNYNPANGGSSTTWSLVESGTVAATGKETLDFVFVDHDSSGLISHPDGRNDENGVVYQEVTPGLYDPELADLLFDPDTDVIGKEYLGTGDHLFRYGDDPSDGEHYGYYYYDSKLNAASYNQSNERFYVYDYLERTTDSPGNDSYSDFLPLNSPYANTNGKTVGTYTHNGQEGYYYDARYSGDENSANHVASNFASGMAIEMEFYLPAKPGTRDENGTLANQSITGEDMVFQFTGDDDVWVLIDDQLVLDIGGIHLARSGSIDFSTGEVLVYGTGTNEVTSRTSVTYLAPGEHKLTMYYLERGASMSNFKLRFNLTTRYSMTLRKEDTLTAQMLNGAKFAVYLDESCTDAYAATLWNSKSEYEQGKTPTNVFEVVNGKAEMWGLAAGNTYYLKEILGPTAMNGVPAQGIIRMRLNNEGLPDYEVRPDNGDLTVGYTVHGYKVDEDQQEAYLVITNTDATDSAPTEISVEKVWNDTEDHRGDEVTAYLVANGARIQSVTLSEANNWKHTWVNLPSEDRDGVPVVYTVHEATFPGYISSVGKADTNPGSPGSGMAGGTVTNASGFENNKTYLLYTNYGYLGAADNKLLLQSDEDTAKDSNAYLWTSTVHSDGRVTLTNKNGQTLYWDSYALRASAFPGTNKNLYYTDGSLRHYISEWNQWQYPVDSSNVPSNVTYNDCIYTSNSGTALTITPRTITAAQPPPDSGGGDGDADEPIRDFRITNTPVGDAVVSLKVNKAWHLGSIGSPPDYTESSVEMMLLANGEDAGLTGTLNLRNGWSYTFENLPMVDSHGKEIVYTVREIEYDHGIWQVEYGPITPINGSQTAYETTVTNVYRSTLELPTTGGIGPYGYITLGLAIMLGGLGWYCRQKREDGRRVL